MINITMPPDKKGIQLQMKGSDKEIMADLCSINIAVLESIQKDDVVFSKVLARKVIELMYRFVMSDYASIERTTNHTIRFNSKALTLLQNFAHNTDE